MILLENEEQAFLQMVMGAEGIIEVESLPTVNIKTKSFYKTPSGVYWYGNGGFNKVLNRKDENDIVTAAVGSSSNPGNYTPSVPGLVKLYNESSGLRLDGDKHLCISGASNELLDAGIEQAKRSFNRPITPSNLEYALRQFVPLVTFKDSIAGVYSGDDKSKWNNSAASASAVKTYGEKTLKKYADDSASSAASAALTSAESKITAALSTARTEISSEATKTLNAAKSYTDSKVPAKTVIQKKILVRGETFRIPPNVFGIIFPWDNIKFTKGDNTDILEGGVSFVWTTNTGYRTDENNNKIPVYDLAIISLAQIAIDSIFDLPNLVQSHHDTYDIPNQASYCKMVNPSGSVSGGTGYAYFYYIDFN